MKNKNNMIFKEAELESVLLAKFVFTNKICEEKSKNWMFHEYFTVSTQINKMAK